MEIQEKRSKLIARLSHIENEVVLDEIEKILNQVENIDFDFEKEWKNGLTPEEFMVEMKKRINNWQLKKNKSTEFSFEYNLEEDVKNGLTADEFKQEMFNRMEKFPWKK